MISTLGYFVALKVNVDAGSEFPALIDLTFIVALLLFFVVITINDGKYVVGLKVITMLLIVGFDFLGVNDILYPLFLSNSFAL